MAFSVLPSFRRCFDRVFIEQGSISLVELLESGICVQDILGLDPNQESGCRRCLKSYRLLCHKAEDLLCCTWGVSHIPELLLLSTRRGRYWNPRDYFDSLKAVNDYMRSECRLLSYRFHPRIPWQESGKLPHHHYLKA